VTLFAAQLAVHALVVQVAVTSPVSKAEAAGARGNLAIAQTDLGHCPQELDACASALRHARAAAAQHDAFWRRHEATGPGPFAAVVDEYTNGFEAATDVVDEACEHVPNCGRQDEARRFHDVLHAFFLRESARTRDSKDMPYLRTLKARVDRLRRRRGPSQPAPVPSPGPAASPVAPGPSATRAAASPVAPGPSATRAAPPVAPVVDPPPPSKPAPVDPKTLRLALGLTTTWVFTGAAIGGIVASHRQIREGGPLNAEIAKAAFDAGIYDPWDRNLCDHTDAAWPSDTLTTLRGLCTRQRQLNGVMIGSIVAGSVLFVFDVALSFALGMHRSRTKRTRDALAGRRVLVGMAPSGQGAQGTLRVAF